MKLRRRRPLWILFWFRKPRPMPRPKMLSVVQTIAGSGSGTSTTLVFGGNVTAGNSIAVGVSSGANPANSITDSLGNNYVQIAGASTGGNNQNSRIFMANNINGGACTVTVTLGGTGGNIQACAQEINANLTLDHFSNNTGLGTTATPGSITTSVASEYVMNQIASTSTLSTPTNYTLDGSASAGITVHRILSSTSTENPASTVGGSVPWADCIASFQVGGGGGGGSAGPQAWDALEAARSDQARRIRHLPCL